MIIWFTILVLVISFEWVEVDTTGVMLVDFIVIDLKFMTYHRGQVPDTLTSHGSMHSGWNWWLHGSTLRS